MSIKAKVLRVWGWKIAFVFTFVGGMQGAVAWGDPYFLPIAGYGPVKIDELSKKSLSLQQLAQQIGYAKFTAPDWQKRQVRHVVMIQYKDYVTDEQRHEVVDRFLRLKQDSRRPNGRSVIQSIEYGSQSSGSGLDNGYQQIFVVTFRSEGDLNYYLGQPVVTDPAYFDPAHEAFVQFSLPYIQKVVVFDYEPISFKNNNLSQKSKKAFP